MTDRQTWSEFICAPERAGRHLASIGRASTGTYAPVAVDLAALQDFLDRITERTAPELLTEFLDLTMGGYAEFAESTLHRLLDALSSEQIGETVVVGPGPRGRVHWVRTALARKTAALPPGSYIARITQRSFDVPINRVLAWLLDDLVGALSKIKRAIRSDMLSPNLERLDVLLQEAQRHHWLGEITPSDNIEVDLADARIDLGRPGYGEVLRLARRRQRLRDRNLDRRWQNLLNLLAVGWLQPLKDDDLFELYALVLTLDVLEVDLQLGPPVVIDLVRPGRKEVAKFDAGHRTVSVFFDQAYGTLAKVQTRYPALTRGAQQVSSHPRRPDIVVTVSEGSQIVSSMLIEVKNTVDPEYISESVYRCFGYIHDFAPANLFGDTGPACVLMVKGAIGAEPMMSDELVVLDGSMRDSLAVALRNALGV